MSLKLNSPDLTIHPPRSPRARLGGYAILPRTLDKARAFASGKIGEYHFNCPLDKKFFTFAGIDADAFLAEVRTGKADGAILDWVKAHAKNTPSRDQIAQWSAQAERAAPETPEAKDRRAKQIAVIAPHRHDIETNFEFLELDDYVSFGGAA